MVNWLRHLYRRYRRWKCRRDFNRLPREMRMIIRFIGDDPDGPIARGKL